MLVCKPHSKSVAIVLFEKIGIAAAMQKRDGKIELGAGGGKLEISTGLRGADDLKKHHWIFMNCPNCYAQNLPTDFRCLQCGVSLVTDTVGGSETYRKAARQVDINLYTRIGGGLVFVLALVLLNTIFSAVHLSRLETHAAYLLPTVIVAVIGRVIASRKI